METHGRGELGRENASAALADISSSQARLANRVVAPAWWWPAQGLIWAVPLFSTVSSVRWLEELGAWGFLLALIGLDWLRRVLTESSVNPWRSPRARPWFAADRAVTVILFLTAIGLNWSGLWFHAPIVAAGLIFLTTLYFGDRIDRALNAELLSGDGGPR